LSNEPLIINIAEKGRQKKKKKSIIAEKGLKIGSKKKREKKEGE
jgi:hypothetical protein